MNLKQFKCKFINSENQEEEIILESLNLETLKEEFITFKIGKLITAEEINSISNAKKQNTKISVNENQFINLKQDLNNQKNDWIDVKLSDGKIIQVSSNGKIREAVWKLVNPENYNEIGIRILKNNKVCNNLPKNYIIEKRDWQEYK